MNVILKKSISWLLCFVLVFALHPSALLASEDQEKQPEKASEEPKKDEALSQSEEAKLEEVDLELEDCEDCELRDLENIPGVQYAAPDPRIKAPDPEVKTDPKAFLKSFSGQHSVSLFSGTVNYGYPIWMPGGRSGLAPSLNVGYSGMDSRFTTLVGYGWSLPANAIYRTPKKGVDTMYTSNRFTADLFGNTEELVLVDASKQIYAPQKEGSFTRYQLQNGYWIATSRTGIKYTFGKNQSAQQYDVKSSQNIYKWALEKIEDPHGNEVIFNYQKDGNALYPLSVRYTGHQGKAGIFEVQFALKSRDPYLSYKTGFPVTYRKMIDEIRIVSHAQSQPKRLFTYKFHHTKLNHAIILLDKITLHTDTNKTLPPTVFEYYRNTDQANYKKINGLKTIREPYGAVHDFRYKPSTAYRKAGNAIANSIPFVVHTVSEYRVQAGPNEPIYLTSYDYQDGHYYADKRDAFVREYAGFGKVTEYRPSGHANLYFYHQSENDPGNKDHALLGEYQDHISKKGQLYRTEYWNDYKGPGKKLLKVDFKKWDHKTLIDLDAEADHIFPFLRQELSVEYGTGSDKKARASMYIYDDYGNVTESINYGEVNDSSAGSFTDTGTDKITTKNTYAQNVPANLLGFLSEVKSYDQNNQLITHERLYYDKKPLGQVVAGDRTKAEIGDGNKFLSVQADYNLYGLITKQTDARGNSTGYTYDTHNLYLSQITNALGHTSTFEYDPHFGVPKNSTDPNGIYREALYDEFGRKTEERIRLNNVMNTFKKYQYDLTKYPFSMVETSYPGRLDIYGQKIEIPRYVYFDGLGRPIQTRYKADKANEFVVSGQVYDEEGRTKNVFLPQFKAGGVYQAISFNEPGKQYEYDGLGRPLSETTTLGVSKSQYDAWQVTQTDAMGKKKTLISDAYGRLIEVREFNGGQKYSTVYTYNPAGHLIQLKNANGDLKKAAYDILGRRQSLTLWHKAGNVNPKKWQWTHDENGNITSSTDPRGNKINYTYDKLNRPLTEDDAGQSGVETTYQYDQKSSTNYGIGFLASVHSPDNSKSFTYNNQGLLSSLTNVIDFQSYTFKYEYDLLGGQHYIEFPDGFSRQYYYTPAGRIDGVGKKIDQDVYAFDIKYAPTESITRIDTTNGSSTLITYDIQKLYRMTNKDTTLDYKTKVIQDLDYTFDKVGNITRIQDLAPTKAGYKADFAYDDLHRLIKADYYTNAVPAVKTTRSYSYDPTGNILNHSAVGQYEYKHAHPQAATKAGNKTFKYDDAGNLIEGNGWTHTYDYKNRLIKSVNGAQIIEYGYDEGKTRIWKKETNVIAQKEGEKPETLALQEPIKTLFASSLNLFKMERFVEPLHIIPALDEPVHFTPTSGQPLILKSKNPTAIYPGEDYEIEGDTHRHFIKVGNQKIATIETNSRTKQEKVYYHHSDHLGGSSLTTDQFGSITGETTYHPFGETRSQQFSKNYHNDYLYTGKEKDKGTDLYYYGARYYDPSIGRFTSVDPLALDQAQSKKLKEILTDPQQLNAYAYARNNPLVYVDPNGEHPLLILGLAIGAAYTFFNNPDTALAPDHKMAEQVAQKEIKTESPYPGIIKDAVVSSGLAGAGNFVKTVVGTKKVGDKMAKKAQDLQLGNAKGKKVNGKIEIPQDWNVRSSDRGNGYMYYNPKNDKFNVRLMPGNKASKNKPYMRIETPRGYTDINGNIVNKKAPEGHIPIEFIK